MTFFLYVTKHEHIIETKFIFWNDIFWHIRIFWKILKKMKMAESSRSFSPIKKVKCSKLARTATIKTTLKCEWKKEFSFIANVIANTRYNWNCSYYLIFCDIIKCAVFLLNMKFRRYYYLKVVNNKSIMFKQLITVGIWKLCAVGNLSGTIHSISAARFRYITSDRALYVTRQMWSQLNIIDNIILSKFWGIKTVFHSVNFCPRRFFC